MKNLTLFAITIILFVRITLAQDSVPHQKKLVYKEIAGQELTVDMFYSDASQTANDNSAIALFHWRWLGIWRSLRVL